MGTHVGEGPPSLGRLRLDGISYMLLQVMAALVPALEYCPTPYRMDQGDYMPRYPYCPVLSSAQWYDRFTSPRLAYSLSSGSGWHFLLLPCAACYGFSWRSFELLQPAAIIWLPCRASVLGSAVQPGILACVNAASRNLRHITRWYTAEITTTTEIKSNVAYMIDPELEVLVIGS